MGSELDFRPVPAGTGDGAALVAAMIDEMRERYWDVGDGLDLNSPDMPKAGPAELSPPAGVFLVGYRDGAAVCGGAVKRLPDGGCEIKRMYVVPAARGQGLARVLLHALEDAARGLGYQGGIEEERSDPGINLSPCSPASSKNWVRSSARRTSPTPRGSPSAVRSSPPTQATATRYPSTGCA